MHAELSIIIPTLDSQHQLAATLAALQTGIDMDLVHEIVVSDGGSSDQTAKLATKAGARVVTGPRGRGGQLGRGAKIASAPWLLFLHADTHLSANWPRVVAAHIRTHPDSAACFRLTFRARGLPPMIVAAFANLRTRVAGLPYGDQGLLIPRRLYDEIGGFPDIPLMEDVAIARALHGKIRLLNAQSATDATRYQKHGWIRQGAANIWRLLRYLRGASPEDLNRTY